MNIKFSCVLEYSPIMAVQSYIWVASLLNISIDPSNIFIHLIGDIPDEYLIYLKDKGIKVIQKEPFDKRNKYCNKLVQLETFSVQDNYDYVFLMDCDTAVLSINKLNLIEDVYAKIVDFPNPPSNTLKAIYKKAGLNYTAFESSFPLINIRETDINNCNGGVYIFSNNFLKKIEPIWKSYANWCIQNSELFTEKFSKHADQVSFGLSMTSIGKNPTHLPLEFNYPIHISKALLPNLTPKIIHFHNCIDEHMKLKPIGVPLVDMEIEKLNCCILDNLKYSFNNSLFWDLRYLLYPDFGSGVGSRGEILEYKRKLLENLCYGFKNKKVLDVGCGDLELTKIIDFEDYFGIDVSNESLKICKIKRPDWQFANKSIGDEVVLDADIIICFDVLIHQSNKKNFEKMVKNIVLKSNCRIIIGAYNNPPIYNSKITHYYNGIMDEIKKYNKFNEMGIMGNYRDITVVSASINKNAHKRDIKSEELNRAFEQVDRPDLLQYLVDVSRINFGFYTSHYPRVFEYTWLLEQLEREEGKSVLDIGAGVSPLPICLAQNGMKVYTVDSHSTIRKIKQKENWNEWGYLDYSIFNKSIKSYNLNFLNYKKKKLLDIIYSISVIEHVLKKDRKEIIGKASKFLKKEGKLLLSIDIVPGTNNIWNLSANKEVEKPKNHGKIQTIKNELKSFGFEILEEFIQRDIPNSRTDILYLKAVLRKKPLFSSLFNWV